MKWRANLGTAPLLLIITETHRERERGEFLFSYNNDFLHRKQSWKREHVILSVCNSTLTVDLLLFW